MKLIDIKNCEDGLKKLVKSSLPVKTAVKLSYLVDKFDVELKRFDEFRMKFVKKYGYEKNNEYKVYNKNIELFEKDMMELLQADVDIDIEPSVVIPVSMLENENFSVIELKALINFGIVSLDEEENKEEKDTKE